MLVPLLCVDGTDGDRQAQPNAAPRHGGKLAAPRARVRARRAVASRHARATLALGLLLPPRSGRRVAAARVGGERDGYTDSRLGNRPRCTRSRRVAVRTKHRESRGEIDCRVHTRLRLTLCRRGGSNDPQFVRGPLQSELGERRRTHRREHGGERVEGCSNRCCADGGWFGDHRQYETVGRAPNGYTRSSRCSRRRGGPSGVDGGTIRVSRRDRGHDVGRSHHDSNR